MSRLSPGTLVLGIFAILFGLLGAYAVKKYTQGPAQVEAAAQEKAQEETYRVPVALTDLPAGRIMTQGDYTVRVFSRKELAKANLPAVWLDKPTQIIGRTLKEPMKQGQAFEPTSFYPMGIGPNLAQRLQPGERAVTIPFEKTADSSLVTPGATIDVVFRANADDRRRLPDATVTLLSGVKVLAVGENTLEGASSGPAATTVTLAVNEIQARALKVIEGKGSMMLALRNANDHLPAEKVGPTTFPQLLGLKEPERPFSTQVYRRGALSTATFEDGQLTKVVSEPPYGLPVVGPAAPYAPPVATDTTAAPAAPAATQTMAAAAAPYPGRSVGEDPAAPRARKRSNVFSGNR